MVSGFYDEHEFFFKDGNQVKNFFFLVSGEAQFVLPEYRDLPYINIS
jgi:hypothetical protein